MVFDLKNKLRHARTVLAGGLMVLSNTVALAQDDGGKKAELMLPESHTYMIHNHAFSPDGKVIVSISRDNTAKVWDAQTGRLLRNIQNTIGGSFETLSFSADSKRVAIGNNQYGSFSGVWDVETGQRQSLLDGYGAAYSRDGSKIITLSKTLKAAVLWDPRTFSRVRQFAPQTGEYQSARFSADGKRVAVLTDKETILWDTETAMVTSRFVQGGYEPLLDFSPDGKRLLVRIAKTTSVLDAATGNKIYDLKPVNKSDKIWVRALAFSPDGKRFFTIDSGDESVKVWDAASGNLLYALKGEGEVGCFSPDGTKLLTAHSNSTQLWDAKTGSLMITKDFSGEEGVDAFQYANGMPRALACFSPDGTKALVSFHYDNEPRVWDTKTGSLLFKLGGKVKRITSARISADGRTILTRFGDGYLKTWLTATGESTTIDRTTTKYPWMAEPAFMPDEQSLIYAANDSVTKIWNVDRRSIEQQLLKTGFIGGWKFGASGRLVGLIGNRSSLIFDRSARQFPFAGVGEIEDISADGKMIIVGGYNTDEEVRMLESGRVLLTIPYPRTNAPPISQGPPGRNGKFIYHEGRYLVWSQNGMWDLATARRLYTIEGYNHFSPTGDRIVSTSAQSPVFRLVDISTGNTIFTSPSDQQNIKSVNISPDGKRFLVVRTDNNFAIHDATNGRMIRNGLLAKGFEYEWIDGVAWDGNRILAQSSSQLSLYDLRSGQKIISWLSIGSNDWVVLHPSGLFDASPAAMEDLYFAVGLQVIEFSQLKERYYEPGLWKKAIAGEELRNVEGFKNLELAPKVDVAIDNDRGELTIKLTNQGGGIGEVSVLINGKEVITDARKPGTDARAASLVLKVALAESKAVVAGQENFVAVKAWNSGHWIISKGSLSVYKPPGKAEVHPNIYIIASGVSNYTGDNIDLKFAAKDAEDIANALSLGARRLFGADKSFVYLLTTNSTKDNYPTKVNLMNAFAKVSAMAKSSDVLVVYLSGHGIDWGGQDGDFYYLTQEAYSSVSSAYNDPDIRKSATISSAELSELFKNIPALKQVLMIDACGSGKVVDNLMARRDIPSSTLRSLDRMKDRTGMHIITGCAANAVSFEASRYGQGVLTYSLLEGIRGAALREDKFLDVNKLFQYAQERVPFLASGIGGIQSPETFSPNGAQSFDVGEFSTEDKNAVPLSKTKTVFIRSNFIDKSSLDDKLDLSRKVNEKLNELSFGGVDASLIFVDVQEYPDGCKLSGIYDLENSVYTLALKRKCGAEEMIYAVSGTDVNKLVEAIVAQLK